MTGIYSIDRKGLKNFLIETAGVLMLALWLAIPASAQTRTESGNTPLGMQQGSPAGSYSLSGFESVNPYSGGLNFSLPLLQIGGRGSANFTVVLKRETKWAVIKTGISNPLNQITYIPTPNPWTPDDPGYGPGKMVGRVTGVPFFNGACQGDLDALTRLTFIGPNGTEFEFRDAAFEGQMKTNTFSFFEPNICQNDFNSNRGRVFMTRDGSSATFISDVDIRDYYPGDGQAFVPNLSGYMFLADGTTYRINNGLVDWIGDRNGNKITFQYDGSRVSTIIDSLNRSVTFTYSTHLDTITYKGFGSASRMIKVHKAHLEVALRPGYTLQKMHDLFPDLNGASTEDDNNPFVVDYVELPDLRRYTFLYNSYGELARVELPTGGGFEYDWDAGRLNGFVGGTINGSISNKQIYRRVTQRRVYTSFSGTPTLEGKVIFSRPESGTGSNGNNLGYVIVDNLTPGDQLLSRKKHYFDGRGASPTFFDAPTGYPGWKDGKEYRTDLFDANGTTILQTTKGFFNQSPPANWWGNGLGNVAPAYNTFLEETTAELPQANPVQVLVNKQRFAYDQYNNKTDIWEYDFGITNPQVNYTRRSHIDYVTTLNGFDYALNLTANPNPNPLTAIHIRNLPAQQLVYDSGNQLKAQTTYEYDFYTQGLTQRSNASGHDSAKYSASFFTRGNVTQTTNHVVQTGAQLSTRLQYDMLGNVTNSTDPRGKLTSFEFNDRFGVPDTEAQGNTPPGQLNGQTTFAFATKVTNALNHQAYTQFDYWTGKPINSEDANHVVSKGSYNDLLDRATELVVAVASPTGSSLARRTRFVYADATKTITTYSDQNTLNDDAFKSEVLYDGLGRTLEARQYINEAGALYVKSLTEYDAMGRAFKRSNPLKSNEATISYTTTAFDSLGRVKTVTSPDGSIVTTNYNGNQATVVDSALKQRRNTTDALGRLTKVEEMQPSPSTSVYATTTYTYDVLDNLVQVNQGSQIPRTFVYDSLKRLTSASNPESGNVSYNYDANSNLQTKQDARGITTTYFYDDLNRLTSRTYTGDPQNTPAVNYTYENAGIANSTGRLTRIANGVSSYDYLQFDALGRIKQSQQATFADGANRVYQMSYAYNIAGEMTSQTYPSGKVMVTDYDTAGRISGVRNQGVYYAGGAPSNALNRIQYTAHGAVSAMKLGNSKWEHTHFNNRLQPTQIGLGTSASDSSVLELDYTYGTTNNNGNVLTQQIVAPGLDVKQAYTYDQCNRLLAAEEKLTSTQASQWKQAFTYDTFGNRNFDLSAGQTTPNVFFGVNPTINQSNNRITTPGYLYDTVGNLKQEPGNKSYTYDAENHQVSFTVNSATTQYIYDGDGRRVKRVDTNTSLVFVYNAIGQLIAEYTTNTPTGAMQTSYLTTDLLGSTRVVSKSDGSVRARYDFLPFGEELTVSRSGVGGYGGTDTTKQKFTGHEREIESGLDFAQARYYSNAMGRFMSVDPLQASAKPDNPQSWNRYAYALNQVTIAIDPDGLSVIIVFVDAKRHSDTNTRKAVRHSTTLILDGNGHFLKNVGRDEGRFKTLSTGNSPNRRITNGDTPFGVYTILPNHKLGNQNGTLGGEADKMPRGKAYGTGIIYLKAEAGEVKESGRDSIYLHGGGSSLREKASDPQQELTATHGCVRCHNQDINTLIDTVNNLAANGDPVTHVFIGDAHYIERLANEKKKDGGYKYPDLRIAQGYDPPPQPKK